MKKDKKKNNTKKTITIVFVLGLLFLIASMIYDRSMQYESWLVCEYQGEYTEMKETLKFRYMFKKMYGYYEYRTITATDEEVKEELVNKANEFGKDFKEGDNLKYTVESEGLEVKTTFYIKTLDFPDYIKKYFTELGITEDSSQKEVIEKLGTDYICKIK